MKYAGTFSQDQFNSIVFDQLLQLGARQRMLQHQLVRIQAAVEGRPAETIVAELGALAEDVTTETVAQLVAQYGIEIEGLTSERLMRDLRRPGAS